MSQYYLMSQLPSLDGLSEAMPLPITEERFFELCSRFLGKRALKTLKGLTLSPSVQEDKSGYSVIDQWNSGEAQLRSALAGIRANKLKKTFATDLSLPVQFVNAARTAVEMDDPLEAENYINNFRLQFLETLRPTDAFCEDAVFYYGLKLKLIARIRKFDEAAGKEAYRKIYNSIINGDKQEAIQ